MCFGDVAYRTDSQTIVRRNVMEQVTYKITGQSALLMNNPASMLGSREAPSNGEEKSKGKPSGLKIKSIPTAEAEAAIKVYRVPDGQLYIPATSFRAALIEAPIGRKIGKLSAKRVYSASVFTVEQECLLFDPKTEKPIHDYVIDVRRAVVQRQGIARARPRIDKWACYVVFDIDDSLLGKDAMGILSEGMNLAGRLAGVLDFRVSKTGEFGRFKAELVQ